MGLDMYVFKTKKITEEKANECKGEKFDEINPRLYKAFFAEDLEGNIESIGHNVSCLMPFLDEEKMKRDNGIPEHYKRGGSICMDYVLEIFFHDPDTENKKSVKLSEDEYNKFIVYEPGDAIICGPFKIFADWYKRWDLHEVIQKSLGFELQNCGYYILDKKTIEALSKADPDFGVRMKFAPEDGSVYVYHPWW